MCNFQNNPVFSNPDQSILDPFEKIIYSLRALYLNHGYTKYRMSKFEEYDLYVRNKDYLVSDGIITFTDTNGRLMALKPDVTLSIIKNTKDRPEELQKLCYNENVYRVSKSTDAFKEIMQTGVECLGKVDEECIAEVICLAAKSLEMFAQDYVIELSQLDILSYFTDRVTDNSAVKAELLKCISAKNIHGIQDIANKESLPAESSADLAKLARIYGNDTETINKLEELCAGTPCSLHLESLKRIMKDLSNLGYENKIIIDFSSVGDLKYYNGISFKGFMKGIPGSVISGGQYNNLMRRMHKASDAIGFAVYLDMLDGHGI